MTRLLRACALCVLAFALMASSAAASALRLTPAAEARFPERAYVLTLPAKTSLAPGQLSVTENGAPVLGLSVEPSNAVGEGHFGTVLVIDTSDTMRGSTIEAAMGAARAFAKYRSPLQPLGVVTFDSTASTVLPLSTDSRAIDNVLATTPPLGTGAHILSAVSVGLQMLARAHVLAGAIILVSDGAQSGRLSLQASVQRERQVVSAAVAQNVRVYAVGVHDGAFASGPLERLATAARGTYTAVNSKGLPSLFRDLGTELSNQYLIRYKSVARLGAAVQVLANVAGGAGSATASYSAPTLPPPLAAGPTATDRSFLRSTEAALIATGICALLIGLATLALLTPRRSVRARVADYVATSTAASAKSWTTTLLERAFHDEAPLARSARWEDLREEVSLARIGLPVSQIVALALAGTALLAWLLVVATNSAVAGALALVVPVGVRAAIRIKVERERRAFGEQLPDNLQVVSSAMRAGHTFVGALAVVADDAPEPSRRELRRVLADEALGIPLPEALARVTGRMDSRDFEYVALVAALQRETGGNTAEVIDSLTDTIRERLDLRRLVRTLTAQGRLSGWIVGSLPVILLVLISLIDPQYVQPLYHRTAGVVALAISAVMVLAGIAVMRRIVDIKI